MSKFQIKRAEFYILLPKNIFYYEKILAAH